VAKREIGNSAPRKKRFQDSIKYLKREEWLKLKESIDCFRDKVIILLLYSTGCRVGELCTMRIEDVDFDSGFIRIAGENTKTGEPRTVRVGREVLNELKAYLKLEKRKSGLLFRSRQGDGITPRRVQQIISAYAERSGTQQVYGGDCRGRKLQAVTPHTLRHTHVVHALMNRIPITAVQKQVGHKRLTTTQIYSDLAPEQVKEAYEGAGFE
jgi:integrase